MRPLLSLLLLGCVFAGVAKAQEDFMPQKVTLPDYQSEEEQARFEAITKLQRKVWQTKVTFACDEVPLSKAIEQLAEVSDCPLSVDAGFLVRAVTPVSVDVKDVSLHSTLIMMLRPHKLTYEVQEERVVVTTAFATTTRQLVRFYPTNEVVPETDVGGGQHRKVLGPFKSEIWQWWESTGSRSDRSVWASAFLESTKVIAVENGVVVSSSPRGHWQTEHFVKQMQKAKHLASDRYVTTPLALPDPVADPAVIAQQLHARKITYVDKEASLDQVVKALQDASGVAVCIDTSHTTGTQLEEDALRVNIAWNGQNVEQALDEFASLVDAGWRIVDDRVELLNGKKAGNAPVIRIYPVRDLVWYGLDLPPEVKARLLPVDFGDLRLGGGTGIPAGNPLFDPELPSLPDYRRFGILLDSLYPYESEPNWIGYGVEADCIAVQASLAKHLEFEQLLREVRKNYRPIEPERFLKYLDQVEAEPITMTYHASGKENELPAIRKHMRALAERIRKEIEPDSWTGEQSYILVVKDRMIIRHRRDIQRKILAAIKDEKQLTSYESSFESSYHW